MNESRSEYTASHSGTRNEYQPKCGDALLMWLKLDMVNYISRESKTTRNVLWSRASVCVSVCLSVRGRMLTVLHGPECNLGRW